MLWKMCQYSKRANYIIEYQDTDVKIHIFFNTQNNNEKSEGFDKNVHRGEGI